MKRFIFALLFAVGSLIGVQTEKPLIHVNLSLNTAEVNAVFTDLGLKGRDFFQVFNFDDKLVEALTNHPGELFISLSIYNNEVKAALLTESGLLFKKTKYLQDLEKSPNSNAIFYLNASPELFPEEQLKIVQNRLIHSRVSMKKLLYLEINLSTEFKKLVYERMQVNDMPATNPYFSSFKYVDSVSLGFSLNNLEASLLLSDTSKSREAQTFADYLIVQSSLWLDNQQSSSSFLPLSLKFQLSDMQREIFRRIVDNSGTTVFENELIVYSLLHEMEQEALLSDLKLLTEQKKLESREVAVLDSAQKICSQMQAGQFQVDHASKLTFPKEIRLEFSRSLLHCAVIGSDPAIVEKLLELGYPVDSQDYDEETALHLAARMGNSDIVQILVGHGANRDLLNIDDLSPYNVAEEEGFLELLPMLTPSVQNEDFLMLED